MLIHYLLPEGSSVEDGLHKRVSEIVPFDIALGDIDFYSPVPITKEVDVGITKTYSDVPKAIESMKRAKGVNIAVCHEPSWLDHFWVIDLAWGGRTPSGEFKYSGAIWEDNYTHITMPDDANDPFGPIILAHEIGHMAGINEHCGNHVENGQKKCVMNPPGSVDKFGLFHAPSHMEMISTKYCDPCLSTISQNYLK